MTPDDYERLFSINKYRSKAFRRDKALLAYEKAHDVRKFEIELYWKRTAYFWAIIAAIFAGFFVMASKNENGMEKQQIYLGVIAITGFVFSYAWFLVNKGSKFWQENWECHIDQLENSISGPLYKTILYRFDSEKKGNNGTMPDSFSVSKVNQAVAFFSMIVWIV